MAITYEGTEFLIDRFLSADTAGTTISKLRLINTTNGTSDTDTFDAGYPQTFGNDTMVTKTTLQTNEKNGLTIDKVEEINNDSTPKVLSSTNITSFKKDVNKIVIFNITTKLTDSC